MKQAVERLERRVALSATLVLNSNGNAQQVVAGSVVNAVNQGNTWNSEMSVAVNPTDPLILAGLSQRYTSINSDQRPTLHFLRSTDGGLTWTAKEVDGSAVSDPNDAHGDGLGTGNRFDPSIVFTDDGKLFISYLVNGSLVVGRSTDDGVSFDHFEQVVTNDGTTDKCLLAAGTDHTGTPAIYLTYWTLGPNQLRRIHLRGNNQLGALPQNFQFTDDLIVFSAMELGFPHPSAGPNGKIYLSWLARDGATDKVYMGCDADGLWQPGSFAPVIGNPGNTFDIYSLSQPAIIGERGFLWTVAPGNGIYTGPTLAVDQRVTGGDVYIAFVERTAAFPNQNSYITLGHLPNGGSTWTFSTLDQSTGTEFNPWVDVDQITGSAHVFYSTTDGDPNFKQVKPRLASSFNGGANWSLTDLTTQTTNEHELGGADFIGDYKEYNGLDVHQGAAHGLFASEPSSNTLDLDSMTIAAGFSNSANTLTIIGDDPGTSDSDQIEVYRVSSNSNFIQVKVNDQVQYTTRAASVGNIQLDAGPGNDIIIIGSDIGVPLTINGGAGADDVLTINGTSAEENITVGTSSITAGSTVFSVSNIEGRQFNGNAGNDTIDASTSTTAVFISGDAGNDTLKGGSGADSLHGVTGNDSIIGNAGDDTITGGSGGDVLFGNAGADALYGNDGNDALDGGVGHDLLDGGANDDTFWAMDEERDTLHGGTGWDSAWADFGFVTEEDETTSIEEFLA